MVYALRGVPMARHRIGPVLILLLSAVCATGCSTVSLNDFARQEFVLEDKPLIHLALRGSRKDRKLICQVSLLTTSGAMWISAADLKLADGSLHDPKEMQSLDEADRDPYYDSHMRFGFGVGYGTDYYYRRYPYYYRRYWRHGPYSYYRTSAGVSIPAWYLLDRPTGTKTPKSLEFTYQLPGAQSTAKGCELVVHIGVAPEKSAKKGQKTKAKDKKDAEAVAKEEKKIRLPFAFALSEKPQPETAGAQKADAKKIVYEILFVPPKSKARE